MNYEWNNRIASYTGRCENVVHDFLASSVISINTTTGVTPLHYALLLMRFSLEKENVVCHKRRGKLENAARRLI
jgi:hypothetical protein